MVFYSYRGSPLPKNLQWMSCLPARHLDVCISNDNVTYMLLCGIWYCDVDRSDKTSVTMVTSPCDHIYIVHVFACVGMEIVCRL